eukprot:scaffold3953_cov264-Alexandrium_tamarense.AAC.1
MIFNHDDYDSVMKIRSSIVLPSSSNDEEKLKVVHSRKVSMDFISFVLSTTSAIRKTISRKEGDECDELLGLKFIDVDRKQKSIKLNNYQIECHNYVALLKEKVVCCMSSVVEQNTDIFYHSLLRDRQQSMQSAETGTEQ